MTFQIIPLTAHSGHSQSKLLVTSLTSFPTLFRPDGNVASTSVNKATMFVQKFASNSSLDDSRATPPVNLPLIMFYPISFCLPEMFSQLLQF